MHRGCFVWTPSPPLLGRRTPRPGPARVCVCVPYLAGSGGPASRAGFGAPHLSFGRSWFALCLFGPLHAGLAPFVVVVAFFFVSFPLLPSLRPRCVLLCVFSGPGCLGPWLLVPPPPFFPCSPSVRPVVSCFAWFPAWGALGLGVLLPPPPFFFFFFLFFAPPPSLLSLVFPAFRLPWASAPPLPPFFFFFFSLVSCFFFFRFLIFFPFLFFPSFFARCAVRGGFVCLGPSGVPRWCCPCCCSVCAGWCCVVLAVGPGCPLLSPGGSWCRASLVLSLSGRVARRPVVCLGVPLPCVVFCCAVLSCGGVLSCSAVSLRRCLCLFLAAARLLCVFWGVVLCVPCPARLLCCARRLCCFS